MPEDQRNSNMQIFCKQMLKTRVFLGQYQEKRFVDAVKSYRDLIVVSPSEVDLIRDLEVVSQRVHHHHNTGNLTIWMGYTGDGLIGAPAGSCIWTEFGNEPDTIPFGQYWFQVRTVRFRSNEVLIKLKMLRPMQATDQPTSTARPRQSFGPNNTTTNNNDSISSADISSVISSVTANATIQFQDFTQLLNDWCKTAHNSILWICSHQLTATNALHALRFLALMMVAGMTGSIYAIKYLGIFTLRFMEEFNKLVHVMMPFLLSCLDLLGKMVGGFYILIAMIWRDSRGGAGDRHYRPPMQAIRDRAPPPPSYGSFSRNMGRERSGYSGSSTNGGGYASGRFRR